MRYHAFSRMPILAHLVSLFYSVLGKLGQMWADFEVKRGKSASTLQSHLLKARGGHQRGKVRKPSARPRQLEVWPRRALGSQESSSPLRQESACKYDGAHSERPTKSASGDPGGILDARVPRPTGPMKRNEERVANQSNHARELGSKCTSPACELMIT